MAPSSVSIETLGDEKGFRSDLVYDRIKRSIIRCELQPGQQVTEEQLAHQYGVSRGSIRPALKRLYQEQLIQTISRNRYVIPPVTLKDANDVFEMRLLLEPAAARQAAGRIGPEQLQRLTQLCGARYRPGDRESAEEFLRANTELHVTIARASGNVLLAEFIANLLEREERLNNLAHSLKDRNEDAHHEHVELVEALAAGDGERAAEVMASGIRSARGFVLEAMMASPALQQVNVVAPRLP